MTKIYSCYIPVTLLLQCLKLNVSLAWQGVSEKWPKITKKSPKKAQNLKKIKKARKSTENPKKAPKKPKKPKKAQNFKIAEKAPKKAQNFKIAKKARIFWVIQFRIVQNELWYTWAFFLLRQ